MEPTGWELSWVQEGSTLSGVSSLRTGAWTSYFKAIETAGGKSSEVIIKAFTVPEHVHEDEPRISVERTKFVEAARLQKSLSDAGVKGWVKVLRLVEDPVTPSFAMEKCGPSAKDLVENRAQLSAKELYSLVQTILEALIELKKRHNRSHGNIKLSDVLTALPGHSPPFKLADPHAKGEDHSANDLFALGTILYQLIEHREFDPLSPLIPTRPWHRFAGKRDKWIQFCNMLLSPNGCHEPLVDVQRLAQRLRPSSPIKWIVLAGTACFLIFAFAIGLFVVNRYVIVPRYGSISGLISSLTAGGGAGGGGGTGGGGGSTTGTSTTNIAFTQPLLPSIDPGIKSNYTEARRAYEGLLAKWTALTPTPRYDHKHSADLAQQAKTQVPQNTPSTALEFSEATSAYRMAGSKLQQAIDQETAEETAGAQQDADDQAALAKAKSEYEQAKARWDAAFAKFTPGRNHSGSTALAKEAVPPATVGSNDPLALKAAIDAYRAATAKLGDALALVPQEEQPGQVSEAVIAAYKEARTGYLKLLEEWTAADQTKNVDLTKARKMADDARALIPQEIVLTDADAYNKMAELHRRASIKLTQAIGMVEDAKSEAGAEQSKAANEVAAADVALKKKDYAEALVHYLAAAKLGNAPAMNNAGLILETGQAGRRDYAEAASWYRKAAEAGYTPAMFNFALLCENGLGVDHDPGLAIQWYKKAADGKSTSAMNHLGRMYETGRDVDQNLHEAVAWYRMAAEHGDVTAMCNLGVMYHKGRGVQPDTTEALKWYELAAAKGSAEAMFGIGTLYEAAKDFNKALEYYKRAATEQNFAPAMCTLGVLYDQGLVGTRPDHAEAAKWFRMAVQRNDGMAMHNLGYLYEHGLGVKLDIVQAVQLYRAACKSNDEDAKALAGQALDRLHYSHDDKPPR